MLTAPIRSILVRRSATISSGVHAPAPARRVDRRSTAAGRPASPASRRSRPDPARRRPPSGSRAGRPAPADRLPRRPRRATPGRHRRRWRRGATDRIRPSRAATSSCDASVADALERRGAPRGCAASCSSNRARSACDASSAVRTCSLAARRTSAGRRRAALRTRRSPARSASRARAWCAAVLPARATTRASSSRAASSSRVHLDGERAAALDQRGVRRLGLGRALRLLPACLARLEQRAAAPRSAARRPPAARPRCARSTRAPRPARRSCDAQLFFGAAALDRNLLLLAGDALDGLARRCATCSSKPTMAFSCRCSSACSDGDRRFRPRAMVTSSDDSLVAQPVDASRAPPRRARAAP